MNPAVGALIGAGISAAGSLLGTHQRNEAQKRESELAYQRERAAIKEQNAYNSASAQMARLQAAGLNPNLMYEQSQEAAAGTQTDVAHYQPAEIENAVEPLGNAGQQMINSMVGLKDMENKTMLAEAEVLVKASTAEVNWSQVHLNSAEESRIYELLGLEKSELDSRVRKANSDISVNEATANELAQRVSESLKRIEKMGYEIKKLSAEEVCMLALLPSQVELNKMSSEEKAAAIMRAYEETRYIGAYYWLDSNKLDLEGEKFIFEKYKVENENEQRDFDRRVQYWNMGLNTGIQVLGMGVSLATKGGALGSMFNNNPWTAMGSRTTNSSPYNNPAPVVSPSWNRTHARSKRK